MRNTIRFSSLAVLVVVLGAMQGCGCKEDGKTAAAIDARNKEIGDSIAKGDAAAVAARYTVDALVMPPNSPALAGRESIQKAWQGFIDSGVKGLELKSTEVVSRCDSADEAGAYKVLGDNGQVLDAGKYIVVWKRVEGAWYLHWDIWNSNTPPPPPPPPVPLGETVPPPPPAP